MNKGLFIVLEGPDGSGKSTQSELLYKKLTADGYACVKTEEPGGTLEGEKIRDLLLNPDFKLCPKAELFLFLADRAEHVNRIIYPELSDGKIVICSRYIYSTLVYQGFARKIMDMDYLKKINLFAVNNIEPDIVFYVDIIPEKAFQKLKRILPRNTIFTGETGSKWKVLSSNTGSEKGTFHSLHSTVVYLISLKATGAYRRSITIFIPSQRGGSKMIEMEKTGKDKTNVRIKKRKTQKGSTGHVDIVHGRFYDELKIAETEKVFIEFDNLIEEITAQGEQFSRKPTYESLKLYKSMIMEFLKYVTKNMFAVEHNTGGSRMKQKIYSVTKIIDSKLNALTDLIISQQTPNIDLLATLDEIRGLLVDLYK